MAGIAPGPISGTAGIAKLSGGAAEELAASIIPLGRLGKTSDIGLTAVYLASKAGSFVTGETIVVDGGAWLFRDPMLSRDAIREVSRSVEGKSRETGLPKL